MSQPVRDGDQSRLDSLHQAIDRAVAHHESDAIDLLRRLIQTPSLTGDEGHHGRPETVAGILWSSLGVAPAIERVAQPVAIDRDNVIGLLRGAGGGVFVLDAHTDTVPPGNRADWVGGDPYAAADGTVSYLGDDRIALDIAGQRVERPIRRRLGRLWDARNESSAPMIYGRGSFDNKGPVAVAWLATVALGSALADTGSTLAGTLVTGFTVDEEDGMAGVRALAGGDESWLASNDLLPSLGDGEPFRPGIHGVALDGSYGFVPVVGHRGICQLVLRANGQSAHAATPDLGVSAVLRLAHALHVLDRDAAHLTGELAPLFDDDLLEPVSLAIGTTIAGGGVRSVAVTGEGPHVDRTAINVVPDWAEATIDCRHPRPADEDQQTIRQRIGETVARFARARTGLTERDLIVAVLGGGPPCALAPSRAAAVADPLVAAVRRHGQIVSGFEPWLETAPGGTDATVMINEGRIKTLVEFGPAGALAHEPHEFVERDQIAVGARILARSIADVLGIVSTSG